MPSPKPSRTTEILALIAAPHFHAGIVLWNDVVIETAPIVRRMKGWSRDQVRDYCRQQNWKISIVHQMERHDA
jgi:hypothetical protein